MSPISQLIKQISWELIFGKYSDSNSYSPKIDKLLTFITFNILEPIIEQIFPHNI